MWGLELGIMHVIDEIVRIVMKTWFMHSILYHMHWENKRKETKEKKTERANKWKGGQNAPKAAEHSNAYEYS